MSPRPPRAGQVVIAICNSLYPDRSVYGAELIEESGFATGSVYPALARLRAAGLLTIEELDDHDLVDGRSRRRKVYRLSSDGRQYVEREFGRLRLRLPSTVATAS